MNVLCVRTWLQATPVVTKEESLSALIINWAVKAAQSPQKWLPFSECLEETATLASLGWGPPTGHNLCCDLAWKWTPGTSPLWTAAATKTAAEQKVSFGDYETCTQFMDANYTHQWKERERCSLGGHDNNWRRYLCNNDKCRTKSSRFIAKCCHLLVN